MRKLVYGLFMLSGMLMTAFGLGSKEVQASIPATGIVPNDSVAHSTNAAIDFAGMMKVNKNIIVASHYSHSSHSSHVSHSSHYSSRY